MTILTDFAKGGTYAISVGLALCATNFSSRAVTTFLGRLVYPLSKHDGEKKLNPWAAIDGYFFRPNCGIRIDIGEYDKLSTIRKVANAALMLFSGALTGALTGGCIIGVAVLALNLSNPIYLTIGVVFCSILGAVKGGLHDPQIGLPFLYSLKS